MKKGCQYANILGEFWIFLCFTPLKVRPVLNDPVNFSGLGSSVGDMIHSKNAKNYFSANSPFFLKYPNYLAGEAYEDYSGYDWYYAAEIYGKFGNGCEAHLR